MKRFALTLTLGLFIGLPIPLQSAWNAKPWLTSCARLLGGTDWLEVYQQARQRKDVRAGALSLAHLVTQHAPRWNLHPRSRSYFARAAQILSFSHVRLSGDRTQTDYSYRFSEQRSPPDRLRDWGRYWTKEVLWAVSPFLFRLTHLHLADQKFRAFFRSPDLFLSQYKTSILALGIESDAFFDQVVAALFPPDAREWHRRLGKAESGSLIQPLVLSLLLLSQHLHPVQYAEAAFTEPRYGMAQYFSDIERKAGVPLRGKKVSLLVDRSFLSDLPAGDVDRYGSRLQSNPLFGVAELQPLRGFSGSFHEALVDSREQLQAELLKAADSDIVVVVAHGAPGDFVLGTRRERFSQSGGGSLPPVPFTTSEPILVFVSCDFGDKPTGQRPAHKELWKQISDEVFAQTPGRSFAAINPVSFHRLLESGDFPNGYRIPSWGDYARASFEHGSGLVWFSVFLRATDRMSSHYGSAVGMREYRSDTGETILYESETR